MHTLQFPDVQSAVAGCRGEGGADTPSFSSTQGVEVWKCFKHAQCERAYDDPRKASHEQAAVH